MYKKWKTIRSKIISENRWFKLLKDEVEFPNKKKGEYNFIETENTVCIVPLLKNGKIVLVRQYRYPLKKFLWQIPMGRIGKGKTVKEAAKDELEEETGYKAKKLRKVISFYPGVGLINELATVFLASDIEFRGNKKPDDSEFIDVKEFGIKEILEMINKEEIKDSFTIIAFLMLKDKILFQHKNF